MDPILIQLNPVHTLKHFSKIHFNIISFGLYRVEREDVTVFRRPAISNTAHSCALAVLIYCLKIRLEELRKTMTNLRKDSQCPGRNCNWVPPERKAELTV